MRASETWKCMVAAAVSAVALSAAGCSSLWHGGSKTNANAIAIPAQAEPSAQVELPSPHVTRDGKTIRVSGVVRRRGGFNGAVDGHIHVDLLSADGAELIDQLLLNWTPQNIPTEGARESRYQVTYVADVLPRDARVRIAVVDDEYAHAFPAPSGSGDTGGGVGAGDAGAPSGGVGGRTPTVASIPSGAGAPSVLGNPRTGRARSTPSTPRQRNSSPRTPGGSHGRM